MKNTAIQRKRLPRTTLSSRIATELREEILAGVFPPGAQLNEARIALGYGVSRGPLREAMQRLIQEGLLRSAPNRGVFVPELSEADLADVFFVRAALEIAAAGRVVTEGDRERVSRELTEIAERMHAALSAGDWRKGADLDFEFHRNLVDAADSERLTRTYVTVQAETSLCLHWLMKGYRDSKALAAEHFELASLIATGSEAEVAVALAAHWRDSGSALRKALVDGEDASAMGSAGSRA